MNIQTMTKEDLEKAKFVIEIDRIYREMTKGQRKNYIEALKGLPSDHSCKQLAEAFITYFEARYA